MRNKVLSVISKYSMLSAGDKVIVGLSGGADSVSLLHVLNSLKDELKISICAAHVNHMIRGAEAERDEQFVITLCKELNIPLHIGRFDIPAISKESGESEELCGRKVRYKFFNSIDKKAKIATAHNLNDSAETFFLNLSRGSGLNGLCGIPGVRENIIRPLIECSRAEIEEYCEKNSLDYVTDSTNLSDDYTRNQIRHHVLTVMSEINPSFLDVFLRTTDSLKEDMLYIESECMRLYSNLDDISSVNCCIILSAPDSIRNRLLAKLIKDNTGCTPESKHIHIVNSLINNNSGAMMINDEYTICVKNNKLLFTKKSTQKSAPEILVPITDGVTEYKTEAGDLSFVLLDKNLVQLKKNIKELSLDNLADYDKIIINSVIRTRHNSDRFTFPFAQHSSSLKNLYREKGMDARQRAGKLFIANDEHILWSEVFGVSKFAAVGKDTKNIVKINFRRKYNA